MGTYSVADGNKHKFSAKIEWSLKDGKFSASGEIREAGREYSAGQCLDEIKDLFPDNEMVDRIHKVWKKWHLNDLTAGSPDQEAHLAKHSYTGSDHYQWALETLDEAGLNPDPNYERDGKPYRYGSAWLFVAIPAEVEDEINSWQSHPREG